MPGAAAELPISGFLPMIALPLPASSIALAIRYATFATPVRRAEGQGMTALRHEINLR
jgi:hypothetical protein